jgi:phenylpropionate dioxygenase-like ring-hydroxylating dioxygenase large terminal subunit
VSGGWRPVAPSDGVAPGAVVGVEVDGADLVVWRREAGQLVAMDARCPHQWSHLAAEGVVHGDELVCLAHCWRFDAAGRGWKVNVNGRRDEKGPIATFPVSERAGNVEVSLEPRGSS